VLFEQHNRDSPQNLPWHLRIPGRFLSLEVATSSAKMVTTLRDGIVVGF
jgi:hypothetical protein